MLLLKYYVRLESIMIESSESTKLEGVGSFAEYVGSGKLKGKKALITGGEYVSAWSKLTVTYPSL
jgi:hypothetical protein